MRTRALVLVAALALPLGAGCGDTAKNEGDECVASSECADGLVCDFGQSPPVCAPVGTPRPDAEPPDPDAPPVDGDDVDAPAADASPIDAGPDAPPAPDAEPDAMPDAEPDAMPDADPDAMM